MGSFLTGSSGNTQAVIRYDALQIGSSQYDVPIPILWGQRRMSYNCIWYNNFESHPVSAKGKGGKGGGEYDYTAAVILALGEGIIDSILNVWQSASTTTTTTLSKLGMTFFDGSPSQLPWSFVTTNYPTQALSYALTSYLANPKMDLGQTPSVPENAFECRRLNGFTDTLTAPGWTDPITHVNTPGVDCSLADIIPDWLTNTQYGMGFTSADFPDMSFFRSYQDAQQLYFSPLLVNQETATDILNRWAAFANTWIYWNGLQFQFVPLGDTAIGGYTPDLDSAYDLDFTDFIGQPPVKVTRKDPADCHNKTTLQFTDRTMGYAGNNAEYKDQTLVDLYGLRDNSSTQADEICNPAVAATCAQLIGKRNAYIRNNYDFKTSYRRIRLIPGSIVTLTEPNIGLNRFRVRITEVEEDETSGDLTFKAEELPPLIGSYFPISQQANAGMTTPNTQVDPGNVNTPGVVEPSSSYTGNTAQLLVSASGGANWGGAYVYISFDGIDYTRIGNITSNAVQGLLTATLASHADPDTVNTLAVDMTESRTIPEPVTNADANALRTLSLVVAQPSIIAGVSVIPSNGELLAFGASSTTGSFSANLTYLRRGQYGTAPAAHAIGDQFSMIDVSGQKGCTVAYDLPAQYIGTTIYLKFASYNAFNPNAQDLSTVVEYQYTPIGTGFGGGTGGVPKQPTGLVVTNGQNIEVLNWTANASTDNVKSYSVFAAPGHGASFGSAVQVGNVNATSFNHINLGDSVALTYFIVANNAVGPSSPSTGVNGTTDGPAPSTLILKDHGTVITSAAVSIDFEGSGVTAVDDGSGNTTVTVTGGGSGGPGGLPLVNGDLPGPGIMTDGNGQCILVPL